mmetsp:Transcript_49998/g.112312  ORF Transcript_49998/g.112312 Transcript_49998/m.112312 type:complete len:234 (-) Transcript_49998:298-999(-)
MHQRVRGHGQVALAALAAPLPRKPRQDEGEGQLHAQHLHGDHQEAPCERNAAHLGQAGHHGHDARGQGSQVRQGHEREADRGQCVHLPLGGPGLHCGGHGLPDVFPARKSPLQGEAHRGDRQCRGQLAARVGPPVAAAVPGLVHQGDAAPGTSGGRCRAHGQRGPAAPEQVAYPARQHGHGWHYGRALRQEDLGRGRVRVQTRAVGERPAAQVRLHALRHRTSRLHGARIHRG